MQTTMNLMDMALAQHPAAEWARRIGVTRQTFTNAKMRGNLSPAIAGALAEELGQDVKEWIVVAAIESERDSPCKARMVKRIAKMTSL
ncbi:hypothetical protein AcdelDRAFT_1343 [Acidovorax delafieldii 2AN]|uniref:HTH cro/C1-type domain-containing protein n=1 Tax=Acidovorax delafieldii 2AN TaxID=573060 RepID=C5T363_ACIDE|nr:hypothetical protein [Acidovorax delafieldii]EER61086.1 hypothetical protein AcdelDRAFT_1343 [Acidovorax delafieldii 2AN]